MVRTERAAGRGLQPEPADAQHAEPRADLLAEQPGVEMNKHARKRERRKAAAAAKAKQAEEEQEAADRRERRRWQSVRQVFCYGLVGDAGLKLDLRLTRWLS